VPCPRLFHQRGGVLHRHCTANVRFVYARYAVSTQMTRVLCRPIVTVVRMLPSVGDRCRAWRRLQGSPHRRRTRASATTLARLKPLCTGGRHPFAASYVLGVPCARHVKAKKPSVTCARNVSPSCNGLVTHTRPPTLHSKMCRFLLNYRTHFPQQPNRNPNVLAWEGNNEQFRQKGG
jgi:hypothetical protein